MPRVTFGDVSLTPDRHVGIVVFHRPPHNYFDLALLENLVAAFAVCENDPECRAIILRSEGRSFCAGTDFSTAPDGSVDDASRAGRLYAEAVRLFGTSKPIVAAVHGAAVGGGLGLAMLADFRVGSPEARFSANFTKVGIHPGFGLTLTLPRVIGQQRASLMFYTGRRIGGEEAFAWGLVDVLAPADGVRLSALALAAEIAESAPLAVQSTRATMRHGLHVALKAYIEHELAEQTRLRRTEDHREGIHAVGQRRPGRFLGR